MMVTWPQLLIAVWVGCGIATFFRMYEDALSPWWWTLFISLLFGPLGFFA